MCAHALGLAWIKQVYFGCENDWFGGNGSILNLHTLNGYPSRGGLMSEEGINVLKKFYEWGNEKVPENKRHRKV